MVEIGKSLYDEDTGKVSISQANVVYSKYARGDII